MKFWWFKKEGLGVACGRALRYNLFVKEAQKGFSLQSLTHVQIKGKRIK
jgi:hypothetical protein